ncbi:hypothetical protein ACSLFT_28485 [Streptomyces sp. G6]|uniref:hypothetical protein n=1 Tax=Streptomyces sp. G6 TaxID=1178736 RepID=UPI003EDA8378
MSVEVELVGGAADGKRLAVGGDPMNPPTTIELLAAPAASWHDFDGDEQTLFRKALYRREANTSNDGPLWRYRYDGRASDGPARPDEEPTA